MIRRRALIASAAVLPAALYVLYVWHYSVNVPYSDDWNCTPIVVPAIHGNLSLHGLWQQYGDTRLIVPKLFFVLFAWIDHYNIKHILLFSAALFVGSYAMLLLLLRSYLTKLSALAVFVVGVVWFSLADIQNSLWSFQLAWYLATFCFIAMIYFLLAPLHHRNVAFGFALLAAIAGAYSIVQGYVLWPVGLICIAWQPWGRRMYVEAATWLAAAVVTATIYLRNLDTANSQCGNAHGCSVGYGLTHPQLLLRYMVALVGNVVPTTLTAVHPDVGLHEVIGTVVLIVATIVVVRSIRERTMSRITALPLALIAFGVLFDGLITLGRFGTIYGGGPTGAINNNRYTMPNFVLLTGIVVYMCAHLPARPINRHGWLRATGFALMCAFLGVQCVAVTRFGIVNGRKSHQTHETAARITANLDGISSAQEQQCAAALAVIPPEPPNGALYYLRTYRSELASDGLSVFEPSTLHEYVTKGPPTHDAITAAGNFDGVGNLWGPYCS